MHAINFYTYLDNKKNTRQRINIYQFIYYAVALRQSIQISTHPFVFMYYLSNIICLKKNFNPTVSHYNLQPRCTGAYTYSNIIINKCTKQYSNL